MEGDGGSAQPNWSAAPARELRDGGGCKWMQIGLKSGGGEGG